MEGGPQRVRTRGPARPRNLAVGCLAVVVVAAALVLLGRFLQRAGPEPTAPDPVEQSADV